MLNDDRRGGLLPDGGNPTVLVGDNRCYQRCNRDEDCQDSQRPHCAIQGRFQGGDFLCNGSVRVWRCGRADDCAR